MFVKTFRPPYLMFSSEPADGGGSVEDKGFPAGTPLEQMTEAQQAAYWRDQSKTQQKRAEAYAKLGDPEQLAKRLTDADNAAEKARQDGLSENEKAVEAARSEGRSEGEKSGREKFLTSAVSSTVLALTRKAGEKFEDAQKRVSDALAFVDVTRFIGSDGDLDAEKVQTFASTLGASEVNIDPSRRVAFDVANGFQQQSGGGAGSVNALREQIRARKEG